jgi:hypothetical protein
MLLALRCAWLVPALKATQYVYAQPNVLSVSMIVAGSLTCFVLCNVRCNENACEPTAGLTEKGRWNHHDRTLDDTGAVDALRRLSDLCVCRV